MTYLYPTSDDAREQWPIARQLLSGNPPPLPEGSKAGYVVAGFGLSLYPGEPGVFGNEAAVCEAPAKYGKADALSDLDEFFGEERFAAGREAPAKALPWMLIAQMIFAAIQALLKK